jgi:hypothetical protein
VKRCGDGGYDAEGCKRGESAAGGECAGVGMTGGALGGVVGGARGGVLGNSIPAHIIPSVMYCPTGVALQRTWGTKGTVAICRVDG